jgi:hypothetical protein
VGLSSSDMLRIHTFRFTNSSNIDSALFSMTRFASDNAVAKIITTIKTIWNGVVKFMLAYRQFESAYFAPSVCSLECKKPRPFAKFFSHSQPSFFPTASIARTIANIPRKKTMVPNGVIE